MALTAAHLSTVLAAGETRSLPAPPWVLGLGTFALFVLLLLATLMLNRDR